MVTEALERGTLPVPFSPGDHVMNPRRSPVAVHLPPHGVYVWETQHDHGFRMEVERIEGK